MEIDAAHRALVATLVFAGTSLAYGRQASALIGPLPRRLSEGLLADVMILLTIGLGAWLILGAIGTCCTCPILGAVLLAYLVGNSAVCARGIYGRAIVVPSARLVIARFGTTYDLRMATVDLCRLTADTIAALREGGVARFAPTSRPQGR